MPLCWFGTVEWDACEGNVLYLVHLWSSPDSMWKKEAGVFTFQGLALYEGISEFTLFKDSEAHAWASEAMANNPLPKL